MTQTAPWEDLGEFLGGAAVFCGDIDVPFDDHLADVRIPVLYLGAAGGFGDTGVFSTTLLASRDVTTHQVRLQPAGQEATDFGHVDLWLANNAPRLAWAPLAGWLQRH